MENRNGLDDKLVALTTGLGTADPKPRHEIDPFLAGVAFGESREVLPVKLGIDIQHGLVFAVLFLVFEAESRFEVFSKKHDFPPSVRRWRAARSPAQPETRFSSFSTACLAAS